MAKRRSSSKSSRASASQKKEGKQSPPALAPDGSIAEPDAVVDISDPGDETQRRFRYQHSYGVILLVGAATKKLPYESIWCEHHDDFLARRNGTFDSFQVKTATAEQGPWDLTRDGLRSAFHKFVTLDQRFPGKLDSFSFVSNIKPLDTRAVAKIQKSPLRLHEAVRGTATIEDVVAPFGSVLSEFANACSVLPDALFRVLQRTRFVHGPSLEDFEASLSSDHVGQHPECRHLTLAQIHIIRDELVQKVYAASSRTVIDSAKHWCCLSATTDSDPWLLAKEIPVSIVASVMRTERHIPFRFSPVSSLIDQRHQDDKLTTLEKKLIKGGLVDQLETMHRRTVSSEQHLLMLAARDSAMAAEVQNQLEAFVKGICDDAALTASSLPGPYGAQMLREVQERLRHTADKNSSLVYDQEYECLVGIAGLLTEACAVWWSAPFDLAEAFQ